MRAIVLSGGGGKGAYEMGVWKALRRLNIKYDIVTGTSIGALNGLLMAQKEYYKGLDMWNNIHFNQIYENFNSDKMYKSYFDKIMEGGINTSKIEDIINSVYDPKKLYHSKIKYGVVSFNLKNRQPKYSTNIDTDKNKLSKYILASATCFPLFKPSEIDEQLYIDGGYADNLPINLAVSLGADEVIAVDLKAIGMKKKLKKNVKVTYIKPSSKLDSFLIFDQNVSKKLIKLGYNDAMKVFKKLEGDIYTFRRGSLNYNYNRYNEKFIDYCKLYLEKSNYNINNVLEDAMEIFKVDFTKIYKKREFNKELIKNFDEFQTIDINNINVKEIKRVFNQKTIVKNIYNRILNGEDYKLLKIFKKEFLVAIYIMTIRR